MVHLLEEYGTVLLAVAAGIFFVGFVMAMMQQDGIIAAFVIENCLKAV